MDSYENTFRNQRFVLYSVRGADTSVFAYIKRQMYVRVSFALFQKRFRVLVKDESPSPKVAKNQS